MCGIAGEFAFPSADVLPDATVAGMVNCIRHRGPDRQAHTRRGRVALGIARLCIIDIEGSNQPIRNESGDVSLVFNGEIYNFKELRSELEAAGHVFNTRGDGECIVHGYEEWGLDVLAKLRGMFAIALHDERAGRLILARDRMGIKPLYLHRSRERVVFGSEVKSILAAGVTATPRRELLDCYLTFRYVPAPDSLFEGVEKLRPGEYAVVDDNGVGMSRFAELNLLPKQEIAEREAAEQLLQLIRRSVEYRLQSDVPLGIFLSGGLDSGFLVALTREFTDGRFDTFSIGFNRGGIYNELPAAETVARRYGTEQHSVVIDPHTFASELTNAVRAMDEPMADPSSVPMRILSMEAKKSVKVVLSGEGSDELFAGYGRYQGESLAGRLPMPRAITDAATRALGRVMSRRGLKAVGGLAIRDAAERHVFWETIVHASHRAQLLEHAGRQTLPIDILRGITDELGNAAALEKLFYFDLKCWLVEDLLMKKDKMGMSASIEARVPYLDQDVVRFAATLPSTLKLRGLRRKYIFRKVVTHYLPPEILNRPKVGFAVPLAEWFRHELKAFVEHYLTEPGGFLDEYLGIEARRAIFGAHLRGEDQSLSLYSLLVLELWGRLFCRGEQAETVSERLLTTLG